VGNRSKLLQTAELGVWCVLGMLMGLRGEEMPLIEFAGMAESLKELLKEGEYFAAVISGSSRYRVSGGQRELICAPELDFRKCSRTTASLPQSIEPAENR
jgi:hypothetical protein